MVVYEVCSVYIKFAETQCIGDYADYKLGKVFNSSAPWDVEAEYGSLEEAEKDFAERRSSVECKGGKLYITEYFLQKIEFNGYDEDGYAEPPTESTFLKIAPIGDTELAEKLLGIWSGNTDADNLLD
jgi:hypothetical protein